MFATGLQTGFSLGTWPGTQGTSAQASPQGPSAASAGFGTTSGDDGGRDPVATAVLISGTAALTLLGIIWWTLPR